MTIDWSRQRILVLAPHPDDETLGCGGLMSKAAEAGGEIYVQFLTVGDTADFSPAGLSTADERYAEIEKVAESYGWRQWHIAFPGDDYHLKLDALPRFDLIGAIERHSPLAINTIEPTVVIAPHRTSYNQDHQVAAEAALAALRPSNTALKHHPSLVLSYEEAADQWRADAVPPPNLLVELQPHHVDHKIHAMSLYGTQVHDHPHTRSELTLRSLAALRGMQGGTSFAEGFHCLRWLG
ncbi:PIG-L deacetylase family protein [Allonocardiopsis opalescens]|uniref:LmbE family N-acetylglucosaminyl deacetylase n=1 Tax=Allonocardiopsis opalescens TaxID=1144618 RepID=A0A2T0Q6F0_9ACTN|nr:PIG-L family deacetylase [Allonocardiopsis opalescens]PRX99419.1 LmbE family N-acetylglucosaminyl deacetylase [Allonocardiopsis opalescens]